MEDAVPQSMVTVLQNSEDVPNDPGKMFIGGLSWQTTPEGNRLYEILFQIHDVIKI